MLMSKVVDRDASGNRITVVTNFTLVHSFMVVIILGTVPMLLRGLSNICKVAEVHGRRTRHNLNLPFFHP